MLTGELRASMLIKTSILIQILCTFIDLSLANELIVTWFIVNECNIMCCERRKNRLGETSPIIESESDFDCCLKLMRGSGRGPTLIKKILNLNERFTE